MVKFKGTKFFIAMDQKMCFIAIVLKMHLLGFNQTKTKMIFFKSSFPKATKLPLKAISAMGFKTAVEEFKEPADWEMMPE